MKKTLLLLLFSVFAFGQNVETLKQFNGSDSTFTKIFVSEILPNHQILRKTEKLGNLNFVLIPVDATEKDRFDYDRGNHCKKCVSIEFKKFSKGGNSDLNILGVTYYKLDQVTGDFLSIFPYWQKNIEPSATTEKTYEKYPLYSYKNSEEKINLVFRRTDSGTWILRNQ